MLDIVLKIITVIGIILLALLGLVVFLLLLVLFFPISYRVKGEKDAETLSLAVKLDWLFGFLRGRYLYPTPGKVVVKLLWFTLYDSSVPEKQKEGKTNDAGSEPGQKTSTSSETAEVRAPQQEQELQQDKGSSEKIESGKDAEAMTDSAPDTGKEPGKGLFGFITAKYEKIKYTISKIYDKIKHIWDNITFYRDLFQEEETQGLLKHGMERLKKIFKNIRPRKLRGNVLFGTGSPDTTGYILAVCGIFSPLYGGAINITPDFEQTVLLGDFYIAGHITIFQVLFHSLMLIFDKRLKRLNTKLKKHRMQNR